MQPLQIGLKGMSIWATWTACAYMISDITIPVDKVWITIVASIIGYYLADKKVKKLNAEN